MADTIIAGNVTVRLALGDGVDFCSDNFLVLSESQEYGTSIGVLNIGELGAVFFLLGKCVFMFFYAVLFVVLDTGQTHDTLLRVLFAGLLVNVESGNLVLNQISFLNKILKRVTALDVDRIVVGVDVFCKVDLGLVAMNEAHLVVATDHTGFVGVDGVVLRADDFLYIFLICKVCFERSNFNHKILFVNIITG